MHLFLIFGAFHWPIFDFYSTTLIISYLNIKIQILIICYWDNYKTDYNIIYFIIAKRISQIMFVLNSEHISKYLNNI